MRRHQRNNRATPQRKSSAWVASAAALMAPADVPQITGNRRGWRRPRIFATARSTPAW